MKNELLPVGSVVTLEGAEKKLMIIGISVQQEDDDRIFDYISVPFPEGYIDGETMFLFMHEDIERVDYIGLINAEVQVFRSEVAQIEKVMEKSKATSDAIIE